jgi:hypothetical protein
VQKRLTVSAEGVEAGQVACTFASTPTTLDAALTAIEASLASASPDVPVPTSTTLTVTTVSPSFEFNLAKELNVFRATYAGAIGAFTITHTPAAGTTYAKYRIIIQTGASTTATSTVFPATILTKTPPTTLAAETYYTAEFMRTSGGLFLQVSAWLTLDEFYW